MEKIVIKNRNGVDVSLRITTNQNNKKLVFLEHGLSARNTYPHMLVL